VSKTLIDHSININDDLELTNIPQLIQYVTSIETIEEFDKRLQSNWYMPDEYKNLDIAKWILDQCQTDSERQRVGDMGSNLPRVSGLLKRRQSWQHQCFDPHDRNIQEVFGYRCSV
jgi:hypothetical protein